ncbi:MAG: energy-coupling factor transporter transmembrane protein EcfT [Trichloromonas sp.]|nr:energy-coupling factor transporter transmembrane protein EcfT [Trichloromonas sp.]
MLDDLMLGRYVPGDSPLHRLDARLKLCVLPLFALASFATDAPARLAALAFCYIFLFILSGLRWRLASRSLRSLRWLLLFTLLPHLFLTPGRTLFGLEFLSYDGLLRGLTVCVQLLLALAFSSLLTLTTAVEALAAAVAALLSPLRRFGLPVTEPIRLGQLVLRFIPLLREEAALQIAAFRTRGEELGRGSLAARGQLAARMLAPLILGLVDRADALAQAGAAGGESADSLSAVNFAPSSWNRPLGAGALLALLLIWGCL